jgi:DNA replication protein DnaC
VKASEIDGLGQNSFRIFDTTLLTSEVKNMKNETIRKLKAMKLPAFAEAYQRQIDNETEYSSLSFHERLTLLADAEFDSRHNNNIKRLIKNARFSNSSAFLGNIDYLPDRHLNRDLLNNLADNEYIRRGLNVILIGATGCGKTYIANALGVNACQSGYKTRYVRLPELFSELEAARIQGKYQQIMRQYQKYALVILDEFLLIPASDQEQRDLLELMEYRCGHASTIFCSQFTPEGWHQRLGGSALADSILDRIVPSAYIMKIDGDVSMRQRKRIIQD